jgi:glycogen synthase
VRVLLHSRFYPSVGGIETVAWLLAHEWTQAGLRVTVVTDVLEDSAQPRTFPFSVHHRPPPWHFLRLLRAHDVFLHFNVSLKALWPLFLVRRPWVASHHGWYQINRQGDRDWRERLKLRLAKRAVANIAASHAIAEAIGMPCHVIPNPYDAALFHRRGEAVRAKELIFVGRLVSDKGADLLVQAMGLLRERGLTPKLTIVGDGPERLHLHRLVTDLGLNNQIHFTGARSQVEVAQILCEHKILVVPSLWNEPFGIVAVEGIACGCVSIGSSGGGLPEVIGPCGVTFPNGNVSELAQKIERLLTSGGMIDTFLARSDEHLAKYQPENVANRYLEVIKSALCST